MPGSFSEDGKTYEFPMVSEVDAVGNTRNWVLYVQMADSSDELCVLNDKSILSQPVTQLDDMHGVIFTKSWHEGGNQHKGKTPTIVSRGKNVGKKNATNVATQALRDGLGLYNKKLKASGRKGVVSVPVQQSAAAASGQDEQTHIDRPLPMLVKKLGDSKDAKLDLEEFTNGVMVQPKLNGVRLVARSVDGEINLYSRKGGDYPGLSKMYPDIQEILSKVPDCWAQMDSFEKYSESAPLVYLDGELYEHGKSLRWISGEARNSGGGATLTFWVFDCFFPEIAAQGKNVPSKFRQDFLDRLFSAAKFEEGKKANIARVETTPIEIGKDGNTAELCMDKVNTIIKAYIADGYEGGIVRKNNKPYRYGEKNYHSSNLLKIKPLFDSEFPVVSYSQGEAGKDRGAVIWTCEVPAGESETGNAETFNVVSKNMTYKQRYKLFAHLGDMVENADGQKMTRFERDFKGKLMTIEYPERSSKTGKPTQAKAIGFRHYEPGPGEPAWFDPIAKLFEECGN